MRPREKTILMIAAGMVGLWLLTSVGPWLMSGDAKLTQQISEKQSKLDGLNDKISKGKLAEKKLVDFRRRSLPTSKDVRAKYTNWLDSLKKKAQLDPTFSVKGGGETSGKVLVDDSGRVISSSVRGIIRYPYVKYFQFTLSGQGTLKQFVQLLYNFYQGGTLQQIRSWSLKPLEKGQFEISINVMAAQIKTTMNDAELTDAKGESLARNNLKEYDDIIVKRNVFAPYVPPTPTVARPAPVATPAPPAFDVAKFAIVSGIIEKGGVSRVLIYVRPTGQELWLAEGENFSIGQVKGTIVRIHSHDVLVRIDGKTFQIGEGESLRSGKEVTSVAL